MLVGITNSLIINRGICHALMIRKMERCSADGDGGAGREHSRLTKIVAKLKKQTAESYLVSQLNGHKCCHFSLRIQAFQAVSMR